MPLLAPAKGLLSYLRNNPGVRSQIAAPPNRTLLYAGDFVRPMWLEIERRRKADPQVADKVTLPEVLGWIPVPGQVFPTLLAWAQDLDRLVPWSDNGFIVWRALSGIFAANASGVVSFFIGSGITRGGKVFAATEVAVLTRNPNVDPVTKDLLAYYERCIQLKQTDINVGFVGG